MKFLSKTTVLVIFTICFFISNLTAMSKSEILEKIRISQSEIPAGYCIGKIPTFAQNVLKKNPWELDSYAMSKLVHRIYPDGNRQNISNVYMTIMANKKNPFGDDIVCYTFIFKDSRKAKIEMKKLRSFVKINKDRSILLEKNLIAVYLLVDRQQDFSLIEKISKSIQKKLDSL